MQLCLCTDFNVWFEHVCKKTDQLKHSGFECLGLLTHSSYILKTEEKKYVKQFYILITVLYFTYYISLDTLD